MMVDLTPAEARLCLLAVVKIEFAAGWDGTPRPWGAASREVIPRLLAKLGIPDTEVLTLVCPSCGRTQRVDRTAYLDTIAIGGHPYTCGGAACPSHTVMRVVPREEILREEAE